MNNQVSCVVEVKEGKKWGTSLVIENPVEVYERLAQEMIAKKINACKYITSIKRVNLYNGFQRITVNYNNGVRAIYTIANH